VDRRLSQLTVLFGSVLAVPAVPDPPRRVQRDYWLVAAIATGAVVEGILRTDLRWPLVGTIMVVFAGLTVLWRRTNPLAMATIAFSSVVVLDIVGRLAADGPLEIYSFVFVLVLLYALFRWGSGRHAALGLCLPFVAMIIGLATDGGTLGDTLGGVIVVLLPAVVGVEVRHLVGSQDRVREDAKERERKLLARELHDTVAHHVSAIAIQAQAGQVVGETRPDAAMEALSVIADAASRTLAEMRGIVSALRDSDAAELAPQPGVADIEFLATAADGTTPVVHVSTDGKLGHVNASAGAAIYRITQESITNARRHATDATRVDVSVVATDLDVSVRVIDDGVGASEPDLTGFGIVGMTERTSLLGGSFRAGPRRDGGWEVAATIPIDGARR
jgi:signal transduction histidine kinase